MTPGFSIDRERNHFVWYQEVHVFPDVVVCREYLGF